MREDRVVAKAKSQHGVISLGQLHEIGLGLDEVQSLIQRGVLAPVHDSVFCLDGEPTWMGRCMAATLEVPGAVVSHLTAAMLHGLIPVDESEPIHITAPYQCG